MRTLVVALLIACRDPSPPPPAPPPPPRDAAVATFAEPSAAAVSQLVVGTRHTCALHVDHTVSCWGDNASHQLGVPKPDEADRPVALTGVHDAIELSVSGDTTCLRRTDRTVACWGPMTGDSFAKEPTSLPISDVVQIKDRCLRTGAGEVYCLAPSAQLVRVYAIPTGARGDARGSAGDAQRREEPISDALDIAGSSDDGCAIRTGGTVLCWQGDILEPITNLVDAVQISLGPQQGCARLRGGTVSCWMHRTDGVRIVTMPGTITEPQDPHPVPGLANVRELSVGTESACALIGSALACWEPGQSAIPPIAGDGFTAIAAGDHTCAARGHEVSCWGAGATGQLGSGWTAHHAVPVEVPGITDAIEVWAAAMRVGQGATAACALLRDGTLSCWGDGQQHSAHPVALVAPKDIVHLGTGEQLTAIDRNAHLWLTNRQLRMPPIVAASSSCAVTTDGRVGCIEGIAGYDGVKLGELTLVPSFAGAVEVGTLGEACARLRNGTITCLNQRGEGPAAITDAIGLAVGDMGSCAVRADHSVWCWGQASSPMFGSNQTGGMADARREPNLADVAAIALGGGFGCARLADGGVSCWGANAMGQLGDGTIIAHEQPRRVTGLGKVVQIATGWDFACAVEAAGTVKCWGSTVWGQLGGHVMAHVPEPMRVAW